MVIAYVIESCLPMGVLFEKAVVMAIPPPGSCNVRDIGAVIGHFFDNRINLIWSSLLLVVVIYCFF